MNEDEKIIKYNHYIMKKYLELFYPNTKDSLYRNFCINYSEETWLGSESVIVYDINELFYCFVDNTLLKECNEIEGHDLGKPFT